MAERIDFTGENFDEMEEFTGPDVYLTYNALDELRLVNRSGEILGPILKPGDTLSKWKDGSFHKIEK